MRVFQNQINSPHAKFWHSHFQLAGKFFIYWGFVLLIFVQSEVKADTDFQMDENAFKISNQPQSESRLRVLEGAQNVEKKISANFYLETYNYSSAFDTVRSTGNPYQENHFGLNVDFKNKNYNDLSFKTIFQTDLDKSQNSVFAVPELSQTYFLKAHEKQVEKIYVGRTTHFTSDIDQRLHLGLIHPYFTQDHVNFETMGLTGIEYENTFDHRLFYFGFYPIFLPHQDPGVSVENGHIVAQNRWANQAPKYFVFNGRSKEINYEIKNYKVADVVFNPAYRLGLNIPVNSVVESFAVGYKRAPLNNIILSRETFADLDIQGQVKLAPVVNYSNQIYSDIKIALPFGRIIYSQIYDQPDSITASQDQSIQSLSSLTVNSLTVEIPYVYSSFKQSLYLTYATLTGGQIVDLNSDGTPNFVTVTKNRQQYFNPFKIGAKNKFYYRLKNPIFLNLSYIFDDTQKGSLLSVDSQYALNDLTEIKIGFDLIGSDYSSSDDRMAQYFLVKSQSFDRVFAGLSYVY